MFILCIDGGLWLRCCLVSNLGWWPSTRSPLNVQLILAGGSEVTLREKLSWWFPFFDEEGDGEWWWLWWWLWWWWWWWWSPAVEGDVPLLVDGEEHRGGRQWRQARKFALAHLGLVPNHKSADSCLVFLSYPLSLGLNLWWGYSGWDGIWEIWIFLQGLRLTTPTLNPCNLLGSLK